MGSAAFAKPVMPKHQASSAAMQERRSAPRLFRLGSICSPTLHTEMHGQQMSARNHRLVNSKHRDGMFDEHTSEHSAQSNSRMMLAVLVVAAACAGWYFLQQPEPVQPSEETSAGMIHSIKVDVMATRTITTVSTRSGRYELLGRVPAGVGDSVTLKSDAAGRNIACIRSPFSDVCYDLLN